eukprot:6167815-Prymnesium_polylepis.1
MCARRPSAPSASSLVSSALTGGTCARACARCVCGTRVFRAAFHCCCAPRAARGRAARGRAARDRRRASGRR